MKYINIQDFLTNEEIEKALALYIECRATGKDTTFARRCTMEIIEPVLPRINKTLEQENDARYLGYAVEYIMSRSFLDPNP